MGNALNDHWNALHVEKRADEVSWYEPEPDVSLALIEEALKGSGPARIIDVGAGQSTLVEHLVRLRHKVAVLDIAKEATDRTRQRLGEKAAQVRWIEADITQIENLGSFDVWHHRAVFHFLTNADARARYVKLAAQTVVPGGSLILGVFAPDGPERCSGLLVRRRSALGLSEDFGPTFSLVNERRHVRISYVKTDCPCQARRVTRCTIRTHTRSAKTSLA